MRTLQEIESAISGLSLEDQTRLVQDLPKLIPELEGDLIWQRILHDPAPSPALSKFVDAIDAEYRR